MLWSFWAHIVWQLRPAFKDIRTFHWFVTICAAFSVRRDFEGVSSFIRTDLIHQRHYQSLLDFFHSNAVSHLLLAQTWIKIALRMFSPFIQKVNGRILLIGDGLIASREGKKMPGVKSLHQSSQSNSKAEYVMGHYIQLVSLVAGRWPSFFAVPLYALIHQGIKSHPGDNKTVISKMMDMLSDLNTGCPYYFIGDAYYSCKNMATGLLEAGSHIITRVRNNAVAYALPTKRRSGPGRPAKYGDKIKLMDMFKILPFISGMSPVYGDDEIEILYATTELLWKPLGIIVKFVFVKSQRGKIILMTTDLSLSPMDVIRSYGLRFKIEVSIKTAVHRFGTFCYHFWLKSMKSIRVGGSDQYLHRTSREYRDKVFAKINAYHLFIQTGLIAQGVTQLLSLSRPLQVWSSLNYWMRSMDISGVPSEHVVRMSLYDSRFEFRLTKPYNVKFQKFIARISGIRNPLQKTG